MQKAPVMKGSGLTPLDDTKTSEEVHVFGRNLEERVVTNDQEESTSISFNDFQKDIEHTNVDDDIEAIRKRKFDAITGEEDEETIFQGEFKLFVWDLATSNWIEKGRGQLKLNDSINQNEKKSRLIMRVGGTLRIILNIAIKRSFFRIIANSKTNIRFTDSQNVWAASGSNAHQLKDLIEERLNSPEEVQKEKDRKEQEAEEDNELKKRTKSSDDAEERGPTKKTKAGEDVNKVTNIPPDAPCLSKSEILALQEDNINKNKSDSKKADSTSDDSKTQSSDKSSDDEEDEDSDSPTYDDEESTEQKHCRIGEKKQKKDVDEQTNKLEDNGDR